MIERDWKNGWERDKRREIMREWDFERKGELDREREKWNETVTEAEWEWEKKGEIDRKRVRDDMIVGVREREGGEKVWKSRM